MATSLGKHPSYNITTSYEVSVNNSYSNTQAQITIKFTSTVGSSTSVLSSGVKVKATCNGSTQGPTAIVGCKTSGSWDSGGTYTKSFTFTVDKSSSSKSVSYTAYAYQGSSSSTGSLIGSHSGSVTVNAITVTSYTHTINHYYIGFNGETGTLSGYPNHYVLATTTATIKKGDTVTYSSYATTIPNGSELRSVNSGNGTGLSPTASYTQGTGSENWNFYYYPFDYSVTYDLAGGENTGTNPSSYNILYGKSIDYHPIKRGHRFLGWDVKSNPVTWTPGGTSNWNYVRIWGNIEPGVTYTVTMDSATVTSGSASQFTSLIYDFTTSAVVAQTAINFGSNINYSITCPKSANPTHELVLLVYSAISGATANIYSKFTNVSISYFSPIAQYSFDFSNTPFVKYTEISGSTGNYTTGSTNYAATQELIPIEGGTVLYSNMAICGIYTYDADGNFIKRESSYTKVHPISSNAAYIRIEIAINSISYETYEATLKIDNEMGLNKGLEAEFSSQSVCYSELAKRATGELLLTARWELTTEPQKIYITKYGYIYARNFIQTEENIIRIGNDGTIYAPAFIEGDKFSFGPNGLTAVSFEYGLPLAYYTLTDENGNTLVDENNNILEAILYE